MRSNGSMPARDWLFVSFVFRSCFLLRFFYGVRDLLVLKDLYEVWNRAFKVVLEGGESVLGDCCLGEDVF